MKSRMVIILDGAIWVDASEEEAEQVRHLMRKMMTTAARLRVPVRVDFKD